MNKIESKAKSVEWRNDAISTVDIDVAIRVVDLAKSYSIQVDPSRSGQFADGGKAAVYRTLSEGLADIVRHIRGRRHAMRQERFAALQGVSFEVAPGSVVGIVGRNGAGKTTLLKVLSRVTEPTAGFAEVYGRVGTLLEVGTGFHPELTGRENVYLSGAILGMHKAEIDRKFAEIVAFAEVERFLDVPLKRYSTGMYLRLAFAVAAHLETEIMLVDEVLAVGDLRFRQRCLGKMRDVGQSGRTILFVSHDLSSVQQICERVIWLDKGEIVADGEPADVIGRYEAASHSQFSSARAVFERDPAAQMARSVWVSTVELQDATGRPNPVFNGGDVMRMILHIGGRAPADGYGIVWWIVNERGERVAHGASQTQQEVSFDRQDRVIECELGPLWLTSGIYRIHVHLLVTHVVQWDEWTEAAAFRIATTDPFGHGYNMTTLDDGAVAIPHRWRSLARD